MSQDYALGGGWGDRIDWLVINWKVVGWKTPRPQQGDFIVTNGRRYHIETVEYCKDPADMFFADVREVEAQIPVSLQEEIDRS